MEFLTLFFVIMTCLLGGALAATFLGFRSTTFEQAVAAESLTTRGSDSKGDQKKKRSKKRQTEKKSGSKHSGIEETDEDDSMPNEDVAVGLLHARGLGAKTTEITSSRSSRTADKEQTKTKADSAMGKKYSGCFLDQVEQYRLITALTISLSAFCTFYLHLI